MEEKKPTASYFYIADYFISSEENDPYGIKTMEKSEEISGVVDILADQPGSVAYQSVTKNLYENFTKNLRTIFKIDEEVEDKDLYKYFSFYIKDFRKL